MEKRIFKISSENISKRSIPNIETPDVADEYTILSGYAAKYGIESKLLYENGDFLYETIEKGAFQNVVNNQNLEDYDCVFCLNHSRNDLLARCKSKTLLLKTDDIGLYFESIIGKTQRWDDLGENLSRGDLSEMSFSFILDNCNGEDNADYIEETKDNITYRTIKKISKLLDISVVTDAAYPQTELKLRRLEESKKSDKNNLIYSNELDKMTIEILSLKK